MGARKLINFVLNSERARKLLILQRCVCNFYRQLSVFRWLYLQHRKEKRKPYGYGANENAKKNEYKKSDDSTSTKITYGTIKS